MTGLRPEQRVEFGKDSSQEKSMEVANSPLQGSTAADGFIAGPWELVEGSDDGNAVISPSMPPWWTAVVICTDRETQNRVARMMVAAPDLLAFAKHFVETTAGTSERVKMARAAISKATEGRS